jgi:sugar phosphate isomerase/epimerase
MYFTLDVTHCLYEEIVLDHINKMPRIRKLHLSNRTERQYHTPLGEGALDFGKLSPDILASGLPLVIEGMDIGLKKTVVTKNLTYLKEELLR